MRAQTSDTRQQFSAVAIADHQLANNKKIRSFGGLYLEPFRHL
jgi:hypothetical protein